MWCLIVLTLLIPLALPAASLADIEPDSDRRYHVRLLSGDILIGTVYDISDDSYTLKLRTAIGIATIFAPQIAEIIPMDEVYPHSHRLLFMPTARPIGTDAYLGLYEVLMPSGGVGLGVLSLSGGRTLLPGLADSEQVSLLNFKATVYESRENGGAFSLACGGNIAWLNAPNDMVHLYGVGTWSTDKLAVTCLVFAKVSGDDDMTISAGNYGSVAMHYATGSVGAAVGFDTPVVFRRLDLRLIGELWCSDLIHPERTAAIIGVRLWNTDIAADVGLAFFPVPAIAPVVNVVWTPRIRD